MPSVMYPSFVAKSYECGMCFPSCITRKINLMKLTSCGMWYVYLANVSYGDIPLYVGCVYSLRLMMPAGLMKFSAMRGMCGQVGG